MSNPIYSKPFEGDYRLSANRGWYTPFSPNQRLWHSGLDFECPVGTPVYNIDKGKVIWARWDNTGGGNMVMIQAFSDGGKVLYLHLRDYCVHEGDVVETGQFIGHSGNTGSMVIGAHLHWELYSNVDPILAGVTATDEMVYAHQPAKWDDRWAEPSQFKDGKFIVPEPKPTVDEKPAESEKPSTSTPEPAPAKEPAMDEKPSDIKESPKEVYIPTPEEIPAQLGWLFPEEIQEFTTKKTDEYSAEVADELTEATGVTFTQEKVESVAKQVAERLLYQLTSTRFMQSTAVGGFIAWATAEGRLEVTTGLVALMIVAAVYTLFRTLEKFARNRK